MFDEELTNKLIHNLAIPGIALLVGAALFH
jgi:hypothetical protein